MELTDVVRPGLMISNTELESRKVQGRTLEVLEQAMELDFFEAYQTVEVPYTDERQRIAQAVKARNLSMTYCLSRVLNDNKLDLSSLDEQLRRRSVQELVPHFDNAVQQASDAVHVISGPAETDPDKRSQQLRQFEKSWLELCETAEKKGLKVIVEPLDTQVHKKKAGGDAQRVYYRYKQRLDGFVSLDAGSTTGTATTLPLKFQGSKLVLNINATGSAKVTIADENSKAIPGYGFDDCDQIKGDFIDKIVTWKSGKGLKALQGRAVRLEFRMQNAKLYAFEFKE